MRVLITGGTGGIGSATAETFATHGATVHLWARRQAELEAVATTVADAGGHAQTQTIDVRDPAAVADGIDQIDGTIDVVVPAAAITAGTPSETPLPTLSTEAFTDVLATNVIGMFTTINNALAQLDADSRVLIPSGLVAREQKPKTGAYGVSKAAVEGLARGFAADIEPAVGVVDPGLVATDLSSEGGRPPASAGEMFYWAGTACPVDELNGEIVTLRQWRVATR